ncbi:MULTISPECIES: lipase family protein [Photorhabdus]|uniref:Lipase n=2 Tax=Photorhabdus asymbiotica TaxID=291112 RepID=B6VND4_PHOAA|nr:lipase family protein [Photorhabdus asymbiotica]RKS57063.1 lipase (class 3) [Photorhabdus asymbiotica]CAQ84581.1 lipase [Photorhabdus asymbiotica]CAR67664.1 lipase [Photorhabdus asymbiotica subsp. asymbiotica ATCC 43949]
MSTLDPRECFDCRILKHWVEFQLVDEQGKPLVNMPYSMVSRGLPDHVRRGKTDGFGVLREEDLSAYPVKLYIHAQSLADEMEQRPLREIRGEEASVVKPKAEAEGHQYRYVTIGQISDGLPSLKGWDPKDIPPPYHFPNPEPKGYQVHPLSRRYVLEVCPFRAWVLLLHHQKEYSLVNAYNQCLMSVLAYADGDVDVEGSVKHFFNRQMVDVSKLPYQVEKASATPVVYNVPFSERYTRVEFIDSRAGDHKQGDTKLFYVASKQDVIISWRGTATLENYLTDATFQPLALSCDDDKALCSEFIHHGKVHKGFWEAFSLVGELIVPGDDTKAQTVFQDIVSLVTNKRLFICGHSLGGALALLHSAQLKEYNPCLYSYGMPRALTRSAVEELSAIIHYRHVNEDDVIPSVPFEQDMDNGFFNYWTLAGYDWEIVKLLSPSPIVKAIKQATASKEIYLHHGKVVHFFQANSCPEWLISARNVPFITGVTEEILNNTTKLYLIPELNPETEKDFSLAGEQQNALFNQLSQPEKDKLFVENRGADLKGGFGFSNHSSYKYAGYIDKRLRELCEPDKITVYQDSQRQFKAKMDNDKRLIPDNIYYRNLYFLDMDKQLITSLTVSQQEEQGTLALQHYCDKKELSV